MQRAQILVLGVVGALVAGNGCNSRSSDRESIQVPAPDLTQIDLLNDTRGQLVEETWSVHRAGNHKLGHQWKRTFLTRWGSDDARRTIVIDDLLFPRFRDVNQQILRSAALCRLDGTLIEMEYELESRGQRRRLVARAAADRLYVWRLNSARSQTEEQPWSSDQGGFFAIEDSLRSQPMQPGEQRTVRAWLPLIDQTQAFRLVAAGTWDESPSPDGWDPGRSAPEPLLMIHVALEDQPASASPGIKLWVDRTGVVHRRWRESLDVTTQLATQTAAMEPNDPLRFDVALDIRVPLVNPPDNIRAANQAVYVMESSTRDLASTVPQSSYQRVRRISDTAVEVAVDTELFDRSEVDRDAAQPLDARPTADDVKANYWLEVNDRSIRSFVQPLLRADPSHSTLVERLHRAVHDELQTSVLGNSLSTAVGALQAKAGDCTEYAMLLAAACRACQIPARVAVGLVLHEEQAEPDAFIYHMWTEVWNGKAWQPLDAMLSTPLPPANRIKIFHSNLAGDSDYDLLAPIVRLMGQVRVTGLRLEA